MAVNKFYFYLGFACGNNGDLLNPDAIVIGGGVSAVGEILLKGIEEYFHAFSYPHVRTSTKIKLAQLGNDAGVIGAASLIKSRKTKRTIAGKAK
ncbi:ROK family protein [Bacillus haynesii]|uniref:ROK family protein n=1 Tax=Bacillus haynesii TaxID=1925021 RepID=UPI0039907592